MATRNSPLCSNPHCPRPSDPDFHRCFVCGKEGGHHHHVEKRSTHPDKVWEKNNIVFLCPRHHDQIDNGLWSNHIKTFPDGSVHYFVLDEHGKTKAERILESKEAHYEPQETPCLSVEPHGLLKGKVLPAAVTTSSDGPVVYYPEPIAADDEPVFHSPGLPTFPEPAVVMPPLTGLDWTTFSDEQLATIYQVAGIQQASGFMDKCHAVHTYRMRHDDWLESAYDLFHASRRTLYAYSNVYEICATSDTHIVENIGPLTDSRSLMQYVGRKTIEEGRVALEAAIAHLAEYGEPPTVSALQHRLGQEAKPECEHEWLSVTKCKLCGKTEAYL